MEKMDSTIAEFIRTRLSSAAVGMYGFFWLLVHAQGVYTTFFVSQDLIYKKYGLLKNEYVYKYFFGCHAVTLFGFDHNKHHVYFIDWHFIWGLILPAILTYTYIWLLPKHVLIRAYEEEQQHKTAKKKIKFKQEQAISRFETEATEKKTDAVEAEITLAQNEIALAKKELEAAELNPEIAWSKDFDEFKNDPAYNSFSMIINAVYEYSGRTKRYVDNGKWSGVDMPAGVLALADSNGLIILDNNTDTLMLTDKGKYFVRRYSLGR